MARYESAVRSTLVGATAGSVLVGLRAITRPLYLRELHLWYVTAPTTSGGLGLNRSTAVGTGALTGVLGQAADGAAQAAAGTGEAITAWGTAAPTITAANTLRRWFAGAAAIGTGIVWVWEPPGLYIQGNAQTTSELVLQNLQATAPGTLDVTFVWDE